MFGLSRPHTAHTTAEINKVKDFHWIFLSVCLAHQDLICQKILQAFCSILFTHTQLLNEMFIFNSNNHFMALFQGPPAWASTKKDSSILDFLTVGCWNSLTARLISANWPQDENDRTQHPPHILRRMAFLPQPTIIVTRPQYAGLHIQPFWISCSYSDHPLNLCWSCPQVHGLACQQTILQKRCHKVEQMNSAPKILWRTPFMTQCSQLTQAWDQHQSTLIIYLVDWSLLKFIVPLPPPCNHRLCLHFITISILTHSIHRLQPALRRTAFWQARRTRTYLLIAWRANGSRLTSSLRAKHFTPMQ